MFAKSHEVSKSKLDVFTVAIKTNTKKIYTTIGFFAIVLWQTYYKVFLSYQWFLSING